MPPRACKPTAASAVNVQAATGALDAAQSGWDAAAYVPPLMAALASPTGSARSKQALLERLVALTPQLWPARAALVRRHALPAVFCLLTADRRPELRQVVQARAGRGWGRTS